MTIRVLLVDDQALFREGLRTLLSVWDDIDIVGEAADGNAAVARVAELQPDVVLMDLRMPVLDGVQATRQIARRTPQSKVIVLTTFDDDDTIFDALRAGAVGYLLKDVSSTKLVEAIRTTAAGESFLQPSVAAKLLAEFARLTPPSAEQPAATAAEPNAALAEPLSGREQEILVHLAAGLTNREIAARVYLAEGTVKNYVTSILGKLEARDRTQAALRARELGLI